VLLNYGMVCCGLKSEFIVAIAENCLKKCVKEVKCNEMEFCNCQIEI